jgi:hypothetical protein
MSHLNSNQNFRNPAVFFVFKILNYCQRDNKFQLMYYVLENNFGVVPNNSYRFYVVYYLFLIRSNHELFVLLKNVQDFIIS